jgi:hypothetical protein
MFGDGTILSIRQDKVTVGFRNVTKEFREDFVAAKGPKKSTSKKSASKAASKSTWGRKKGPATSTQRHRKSASGADRRLKLACDGR